MQGSDAVPVASNLLESKFLGFSIRRVLESIAIPLGPCLILYAIGFPLVVTLPLFLGGLLIGGTVYVRAPPGQNPLSWSLAVIRHRTGANVYTWTRPTPGENDLSQSDTQDEWLTRATPPGRSRVNADTQPAEQLGLVKPMDENPLDGVGRGAAPPPEGEEDTD